jgi:protein involved in polysaccharide export with SLBB domain
MRKNIALGRTEATSDKMDRRWSSLLLIVVATACRSFDEGRVVQTLNQRGFGRKYIGDSNEVLTIGIGDSIQISDPLITEITGHYTVRMDGVIEVDLLNEVFVAGFTTSEIAETLNQRFKEYYKDPHVRVQAMSTESKSYFIQGEVAPGRHEFKGNTTVWDAVMVGQIPATADLADIRVIRPDPVHPLVIPVDLEKMLYYGDSRDNILLREDDIVYVSPNLAGYIKNAVELILEPIQPIEHLAISIRNIETLYESFKDNQNFFVGAGNSGYGGTYGGGGYSTGFSTTGATGATGAGGNGKGGGAGIGNK